MLKVAVFLIAGVLSFTLQAAPVPSNNDETLALHALNRLGYGPRPGDLQRVLQMGVDAYIDEQLHPERIPLEPSLLRRLSELDAQLPGAAEVQVAFRPLPKDAASTIVRNEQRQMVQRRFAEQRDSERLLLAVESPRQLQEVMVDFWFNHFNIYGAKELDRVLVNSYERDAIRPYVLGHFVEILSATAHHPAMLFYLDNWRSVAASDATPGFSTKGRKRGDGLNENYARELMELHTLGVDGGYTQHDVTELARMLTGWTFQPRDIAQGPPVFKFDAADHDNGVKTWLGRTVEGNGVQEGEMALAVLAMHPATAHHISYQLAQYFVADNPSSALVDLLTKRYLRTHGNIREVLALLFASPEFRAAANAANKFKTPYQYVVSAARAAAMPTRNVRPYTAALAQLGQPLYACLTPDGYTNMQAVWLTADALSRRINFAVALASGRLPVNAEPAEAPNMRPQPVSADALLQTLGRSIGEATRKQVANAEPGLQAAMILGSPDFMHH
jgi:uncharacterized protein (DUF1800 family)